jgi:hypothetical protein
LISHKNVSTFVSLKLTTVLCVAVPNVVALGAGALFAAHSAGSHAHEWELMLLELQQAFVHDLPTGMGRHGATGLNRHHDILPNPHTRVVLSKVGNDAMSTYINANHIPGKAPCISLINTLLRRRGNVELTSYFFCRACVHVSVFLCRRVVLRGLYFSNWLLKLAGYVLRIAESRTQRQSFSKKSHATCTCLIRPRLVETGPRSSLYPWRVCGACGLLHPK